MKIFRYAILSLILPLLLTCSPSACPADAIQVSKEDNIVIEEVIEEPEVITVNPILQYFIPLKYKQLHSREEINQEITFLENYIISLKEIQFQYEHYSYIFDEEIDCAVKLIEIYKIESKFVNYTVIEVPEKYSQRDFKTYEDYTKITSKNSPHYKLQNAYAYTGEFGIRMVEERFCIALGSYFTTAIGQYVDIILANGTIIPCILGDQKANGHTDSTHIAHSTDGSVVEFIVEKSQLEDIPRKMGNISYCCDEWKSPVVQIKVYDTNFFNE